MSQEHFNRSASTLKHTAYNTTAIVKWSIRVERRFLSEKAITMTNGGGGRRWQAQGESIVISRRDVETVYHYASTRCDLRDHTMIRLPIHSGVRTREIATLMREDINFETGIVNVLDSKKHRFYPIPLDIVTLQLLNDLTAGAEGLVFRHKTYKRNKDKPLTNVTIWKLFRTIGEAAGVKKFTPRLCRHHFAANSMYPESDENGERKQPMKIETLRRILRHANLAVTTRYLVRLVFIEDIKRDYDRLQNPYVVAKSNPTVSEPLKGAFYEEYCRKCIHEETCKFKEQICSCQACLGCRFFKQKKELMRNV